MKILYDHQIWTYQVYGGVSRYFFELMNQFRQIGFPQFELALVFSKNYFLKNASFNNRNFFYIDYKSRKVIKIISAINRLKSQRTLLHQPFDIFHPTHYDSYFLKLLKGKPFVLTIFDMIHEMFYSQYSKRSKADESKKLLAQKAKKIITISENTKKDIVRFFPDVDEEKIIVTYLANSLSKSDVPPSNLQIPSRYIFYVGSRRASYKNFYFFIRSISPLLREDKDLNVVCVSEKSFKDYEKEMFKSLQVEKQIQNIQSADETLSWLYKNALAFVLPSLYEGFGIPVLEAFACGCPVILSNASSLPEVGGEAAVYFNPRSELSMREAVSKVIYNKEIRDSLRTKGIKQLEKFSWRKTAEETNALYESIL